ncbi:MAG: hypothetical protein ABR605_08665 [Desulfurivibrionaceae bacterium]
MRTIYNKKTRKKLRELAAIAHERELAAALNTLHEDFAAWQAGKVDVFELNDRIHQFHQKTSREIWKLYCYQGHADTLVSRAVKLGYLTEDEIGTELVAQLGPMISYWQEDESDEG